MPRVWLCMTLVCCLCPAGWCVSRPAPVVGQATPSIDAEHIRQLGPGLFRIGEVEVDAQARELRMAGHVNMATGLIEVVLCTPYGKTHESVLVTPARPRDVHIGLLLLGLRDGSNPGWFVHEDPRYRPAGWDRPPGDRLDMYVAWEVEGVTTEIRAESTLMDIRNGETLPSISWVFTGSFVWEDGLYLADESGSIVTNFHDRGSVIDSPLTGGRVDDYTYANYAVIPPVGTPVRVRMVAVSKEQEAE